MARGRAMAHIAPPGSATGFHIKIYRKIHEQLKTPTKIKNTWTTVNIYVVLNKNNDLILLQIQIKMKK